MIEEILPELFRIEIPLLDSPLKYLNSYVLRSAARNVIVDTGLNRKACLNAMHQGLHQLEIDLNKTDFFITHLHADHFGLVARLMTNNSRIYFNRPEAELIDHIVAHIEAGGGDDPFEPRGPPPQASTAEPVTVQ